MTYAGELTIWDADSHLMELPGWLESYADPAERALLRPLHLGAAGALADAAVARASERSRGEVDADASHDTLMTAKGWDALGSFAPEERRIALDLLGFARQLVFATFAFGQFLGSDPAVLRAGCRAHNRALAEFCADDDRLIGVGYVPLHDPEMAEECASEALAFGCRALHLPSAPPKEKAPTHPDFDRLWEIIAGSEVPVVLHLGGQGHLIRPTFHNNGRPVPDLLGGGENVRAKDVMAMHVAPEIFVSSLILDGLFDRFPSLMVGIIEQGGEWVVPWLFRLDRTQRTFSRTEPTIRQLELSASDYVHRNVRVTPFAGERVGWMIEQAGEDIFMFSSDYPHPEGTTDPIARFEATMGTLSDQARRRFYHENLQSLLGATVAVRAA